MRVLTDAVNLDPVGGIEVCTLEDVRALAARGVEVDLLFGRDGSYRPRYEAAGVALHGPFRFTVRRRGLLRDLADLVRAARLVRTVRADVIWLNRAEHLVWGVVVAAVARRPLVVHLHHLPASRWVRLVARRVRRFAAVSAFMRQRWVEAGVPADAVQVVRNALPAGAYPFGGEDELRAARRSLGVPERARVVAFLGRFAEEKGFLTLIDAVRRIDRDDVVLLLAGGFPPVGADEARLALAALDPARVVLLPPVGDVTGVLHAADVVAMPSLVQEAFGRAAIEGLASGRPAVASRVGALPELLEDGMARMLVEPADAGALAAAIGALLDWRTTEPALGASCHEWAARRFPYDDHVRRLHRLLADASAGHRRPSRRGADAHPG